MKLQDYIQYYIGCRIEKDLDALDYPIIEGLDRNNVIISGYRYTTPNCNEIFHRPRIWRDISSIKPILRKLESLTEDEMKECGNLVYDFSNDPDLNTWHWSNFEAVLCAEQFDWLLKRGFDLFDLIKNGLAIDSKTLK